MNAAPTGAPRLPRELLHQLNRLAARRAKLELHATWRRHQAALHAAAIDLLLAGRDPAGVLRELQTE